MSDIIGTDSDDTNSFWEAIQAAAVAASERKRARKEKRAVPETLPPLPEATTEGARAINTAIEKNRGLTPHRNKAGKNPRKKNRTKFEKATIARKGQVRSLNYSLLLTFHAVHLDFNQVF